VVRNAKRHENSSQGPMIIIKDEMTSMKWRGSITNILQRTISMGISSSRKFSKS
jgi:hypothetical protein